MKKLAGEDFFSNKFNKRISGRISFCSANTVVSKTYVSMNGSQIMIIDIFEIERTSFSLQIQVGNESV